MKLTVDEAAELLAASEERVHDWIEDSALPAQKIRGQYRINRTDLLEWATEHNVAVAPHAFRQEGEMPSLAEALRAGGVHDGLPGPDLAAALGYIVPLLPLADHADRETLLQILLARGTRGWTPIGDGIAIPQVRMPIILVPKDVVLALSFLTLPLDLGAPDGHAVDTLFFLICPSVRVHLAMFARLVYGLKNEKFRGAIRRRASAAEIVRMATAIEEGL